MFGEVCTNFTYNFHWENNTYAFDHELECTVSKTVFVLFTLIGVAGLVGNALVVLGKSSDNYLTLLNVVAVQSACELEEPHSWIMFCESFKRHPSKNEYKSWGLRL
jgi:hypothetical protein